MNLNLPKPVIFFLIGVVLVIYTGFNYWLFVGRNTAAALSSAQHSSFNSNQFPNSGQSAQANGPPPTPLPTPTPLRGPGQYACDPTGICNDYSDEMRKNCTFTFADRNCLEQCANPAKRCKQ